MKSLLKVVAVGSAIALGTAALPANSYAGDREWATVGKVLTGVAAVELLRDIIHTAPHVAVTIGHGVPLPPPPPVCAPPPPPCVGFGYWSTVVDPPEYGWVWNGYRRDYVIVRPSCARRVWVPQQYEARENHGWGAGHGDVRGYAHNGPRGYGRDRD